MEQRNDQKNIRVACAIIERNGKVLATQRSSVMPLPLKWEFPGGKIKNEETPEECLRREVCEELNVEISVGKSLTATTHRYPAFVVTLYPFLCRITSGEIELREHAALAWMKPDELHLLDWAEADRPIIEEYRGGQ
jgi:8-oxo-dGTP diphosphatase